MTVLSHHRTSSLNDVNESVVVPKNYSQVRHFRKTRAQLKQFVVRAGHWQKMVVCMKQNKVENKEILNYSLFINSFYVQKGETTRKGIWSLWDQSQISWFSVPVWNTVVIASAIRQDK